MSPAFQTGGRRTATGAAAQPAEPVLPARLDGAALTHPFTSTRRAASATRPAAPSRTGAQRADAPAPSAHPSTSGARGRFTHHPRRDG